MNIRVFNHVNLMVESLELLIKYTNQESPSTFKENLIRKYSLKAGMIDGMFDQIIAIYDHVVNNLQVSSERLNFFFAQKEDLNWCCAHLLLMDTIYQQPENVHRLLEEADTSDKAVWMNRYAKSLISYVTDDSEEFNSKPIEDEHALFQVIDSFDLDAERKWLCMQVYLNYKSYLSELLSILDQAAALYKPKLPQLQSMLDEFHAYHEEIIKQQSTTHLFASFKMTISDSDHDVHIYPSIMGFNSARLDNSNEHSNIDYIYTGVLFDKLSSLVHEVISDDSICKQLKVLSDTSKYAILKSIRDMPAYGQELAERLDLTTATISHHMNTLINCGFIKIEKRANRIYYQMDKEKITQFLEHVYQNLISSDNESFLSQGNHGLNN